MTADITFNTTVDNNFTPIGEQNKNFYGTFDGQGHTISGIRINKPSDDYIGIFGALGSTTAGVVKNLVVRNCSIVADAYVGVIAGDLTGGASGTGIIENCHVGDDVTLSGHLYVGGIAGISNKATIEGCTCAATITGTKPGNIYAYELGGIAGQINSGTSLIDNIFTGTISGDLKEYIGAIVGNNANGDLKNLGNNVYTSTGFDGIGAAGNPTPGTNPENKAKFAYLITAGKNVTVAFNGAHPADTQFGPNGISVYDKGMKYANYVVSYSTSVDLLLSYKPGFIVTGYTASAGTLNGTAHTGSNDAYTLSTTEASTITAIVDLWGNLTGDADGTEDHPYILSSPEALDLLSEKVNGGTDYSDKYFKLGADIEYDPDVENNFTPIGNASHVFGGTFDGDGKTISGLNIKLGMTDYVGLFGCTNASSPTTIKGVKLENSTITGRSYVGGILGGGSSSNTSILNCVVTSAVTVYGSVENVGGIVGKYATVRGCTSAAAVEGYQNVGGIIGNGSYSTVEYCLYTGNSVTARDPSTPKLGAIIGDKDNCSLNANYYTQATIGGSGSDGADVAGARKALTVTLPTNGIPSGTATVYNVSGITGYTGKSGGSSTTENNIILYNDGTTSTYYSGADESVIFLYNYDGYQVSVTDADGNVDFTKDIKQTTTNIYYNYTFTMPAKAVTITATDVWGVAGGKDGLTADKAYTITTIAGLDLLAQNVNAGTGYSGTYFKLGKDIEYNKNTANNFTPIGYTIIDENNQAIERPFRGHFDGNGKTISGINLNNSDVDNHGIFGPVNGTVKNLVVSNCSIVADHNIGAIVGVLHGTIENCHVGSDVTLSGHKHVGGIAGWCAATIKGCTSAATITGTNSSDDNANRLGGIVGATNGPSSLTDNLFTGAINGKLEEYIGAIFGWGNEYATLTNNVYTSAGFGGIGAEGSATGADGAGARKAVAIGAAEGVTITPTGEATTYNVSGITTYADNNVLGYDSKLYAGATDAVKLSIVNTGTPETGYEFSGFTAGEGVTITSSENVYTLTVPASDVTVDVVNQAIIYNITYKGVEDEGVTFTEDNPEAYTVADESFALNNPSREGYLFTGWTYEGQDEPTKTVTIAMGSTGDKTFTANWEEFVETEVETAVINEAAKEVEITKVMVPKGETKAVIPATVNGYTVTNIAKGAFYYKTGEDHVQDIFLPDTKRLINIEEGALIIDKLMEPTLHVPLELLSDYANMPGLKLFFEADKIQAMAVAPNKFWTFSCGIDVKVPKGVKVYTCRMNDDKTAVLIHELTDDELGGVIKANNGVLLSSARGAHPFIVNHATATEVGKSYENNLLEPVLKTKNYASGKYYVLKDNEFHPIIKNDSEVPACKAVLHWASSAKARLEIIVGDDVKTAINGIAADEEGGEWYTISGQRIDKPTKKGLYIKNGKKVIIK